MRKTFLLTAAAVLALGAGAAQAKAPNPNLVQNGGFETNGGVGQVPTVSSLANWTVGATTDSAANPFTFVLDANADSTGFNSPYGTIRVWGPNTPVGTSSGPGSNPNPHATGPVANGFSGSPDGGYFFGADAAYADAPISQTINGLTAGHQYTLSFSYAGAQFTDALGPNQEGWNVTFGGDSASTSTLNNASEGFTGWNTFSQTFTASSSSQLLSFLATGGPSGLPPFALLDGVSLTDSTPPPPPVPEPATWAMMIVGMGAMGAVIRRRRAGAVAAA